MPARLIPIGGGSPIPLDKPITLIGRHPDCDAVLLASSKVSRRHCCIAQINQRYVLRDLGSMNGVRINGARKAEGELRAGDEIAIGDVYFSFCTDESSAKPAKRQVAPGAAAGKERHLRARRADLPPTPPPPDQHSFDYPVAIPEPNDSSLPLASEDIEVLGDDLNDVELKDESDSQADYARR